MRFIHHSSDEIGLRQLLGSSSSNCGSSSKLWPLGLDQNSLLENWMQKCCKTQDATIAYLAHKSQVTTYNVVWGFRVQGMQCPNLKWRIFHPSLLEIWFWFLSILIYKHPKSILGSRFCMYLVPCVFQSFEP